MSYKVRFNIGSFISQTKTINFHVCGKKVHGNVTELPIYNSIYLTKLSVHTVHKNDKRFIIDLLFPPVFQTRCQKTSTQLNNNFGGVWSSTMINNSPTIWMTVLVRKKRFQTNRISFVHSA